MTYGSQAFRAALRNDPGRTGRTDLLRDVRPSHRHGGVAEVAVSSDARVARVRVLLSGDAQSQKDCLDALNGAKSYIRRVLTQRIALFRIPELHFEAAVPVELGSKLDHLLKRVRRGRPRTDDAMQVAEDKLTSEKKPVS